jgi:tRNA threonylcarbamoyladenosine biosynthesis protein TsaB
VFLLGLDTATPTLSAALVSREHGRDALVARVDVPPPKSHSQLLPQVLLELLAQAGLAPLELAAVVSGIGPGSFTGVRIGLATAKGLCYAARVPLVGASSLAAMALAAVEETPEGALLLPCIDARKGQVYCAAYRRISSGIATESDEEVVDPERLVARLADPSGVHVFGPGRLAYEVLRRLPPSATTVEAPDAFALVRGVRSIPAFSKEDLFAIEPQYVRPSDSEWTLKKKGSVQKPARPRRS